MDCTELKRPKILTELLRINDESTNGDLVKCFFELYFEYCIKFAKKHFFLSHSFDQQKSYEIVLDSFLDTLEFFFRYIKINGYEDRGFKFDTFFMLFFRRSFRDRIRKDTKLKGRMVDGDPDKIFDITTEISSGNSGKLQEENLDEEMKYYLYEKALTLLNENCRNLIKWRKLERLSNEEIAGRTDLKPASVNNEVFKCFNKLKQIVDNLNIGLKNIWK